MKVSRSVAMFYTFYCLIIVLSSIFDSSVKPAEINTIGKPAAIHSQK